ncbi:MAG: sensor domain-containing diguanylate cyclase [Candidatus Eremiobacteraeota bacterium]|nr:sensor domain-containing diguanylate cyclase [Candidatus Eremiobacteraeota bacterium]
MKSSREESADGQDITRQVIAQTTSKVCRYLDEVIEGYNHSTEPESQSAKDLLLRIKSEVGTVLSRELTEDLQGLASHDREDDEEIERLRDKLEEFKKLVDVSLYINETLDHVTVLSRIMETVKSVMNAEACSLFLIDEDNPGLLRFTVALGDKGEVFKTLRIKVGEGIAGTVAKTGEIIQVDDAQHDERFARKFDRMSGFVTRAILCVPIRVKEKGELRISGALEVINKRGQASCFDSDDKELLLALSSLAAVSIENARVYHHAITDRLTKLYNFGYFQDQLFKEVSRSVRYGNTFSLMIIDLDNFKKFNDTYGHPAGNEALKKIAALLWASARDSDIVSRYGGEEFAIILTETRKEEAAHLAERIRRGLEELEFDEISGSTEVRLTMSIGISSFPQDGRTAEIITSGADNALYRAKSLGRNRVILCEE